jgi:hypothetical protein
MPRITIDVEAGPDMVQLLHMIIDIPVLNINIDYQADNRGAIYYPHRPKPLKPVREKTKKRLLRDQVMELVADAAATRDLIEQQKPPQLEAPERIQGKEVIRRLFSDGAVHSRATVIAAFVKAGHSKKGVDGRIAEAVTKGHIVRVGTAVYQLSRSVADSTAREQDYAKSISTKRSTTTPGDDARPAD